MTQFSEMLADQLDELTRRSKDKIDRLLDLNQSLNNEEFLVDEAARALKRIEEKKRELAEKLGLIQPAPTPMPRYPAHDPHGIYGPGAYNGGYQ